MSWNSSNTICLSSSISDYLVTSYFLSISTGGCPQSQLPALIYMPLFHCFLNLEDIHSLSHTKKKGYGRIYVFDITVVFCATLLLPQYKRCHCYCSSNSYILLYSLLLCPTAYVCPTHAATRLLHKSHEYPSFTNKKSQGNLILLSPCFYGIAMKKTSLCPVTFCP